MGDGAPLHSGDWLEDAPDCPHLRFFKSVNWAATPLGPLDQWPIALRHHTYQLLADSRPAVIYWGPDLVSLYNEAFTPLAGTSHPSMMGLPFEVVFPEIWTDIRPVFDGARASKKAVNVVEIPLMVERNAYTEESYFTGNFTPVRGDGGQVDGFYNALSEVTRQKLNDRRRAMLNLLSKPTEDHTTESICTHIIDSLRTNPHDVPFAALYQAGQDGAATVDLRGSIGLPPNHQLAVPQLRLDGDLGLAPLLRNAQSEVATIPYTNSFDGIHWAGFGDPPRHVSAVSVWHAGRLLGFLVIGANPRRPIDDDHDQFMHDLSRNISSLVVFTSSVEQAAKRQKRLADQLADSERHFRHMAQDLEIGMEHLSVEGRVIWANEHFYTLIGQHPHDLCGTTLPFMNYVHEQDKSCLHESWLQVSKGCKVPSLELRLKRQFSPPSGEPVPVTVLLTAFPYMEDGKVEAIMACMTDVSQLKWAESWHARAAEEAQEARRQQSEFTDAVSHEVRNPLSAIFQLADGIVNCLAESRGKSYSVDECLQMLHENVEAARTLLVCANHQKRLVDDVLTLSKMDFTLMSLSPTAVKPTDLVEGALKMLKPEFSSSNTNFVALPEPSLAELAVQSVFCDSLRVTQILINLLSNAIKFTKRESRRDITLRYGASMSDPQQTLPNDIIWAASKHKFCDVTLGKSWQNGEQIYLTFLISDTGPGMDEEELKRLFNRFEQASPRTSIKYGGSGLGLFISHTLSEKQSGRIGVASKPGEGSTFAFYIKGRRNAVQNSHISGLSTTPSVPPSSVVLPSRKADMVRPTAEDVSFPHTLASHSADVKSATLSKEPYHILMVEDNVVNQRILRKQLMKAGCVVYVANHGLEALDILQSMSCWKGKAKTGRKLDIILMDWEMPVMDGLTASREIRSLERSGQLTRHVEIIAVTANVRQEQVDRAMAAGMNEILPKPFVVSDLLDRIKERVGR